jgi:hypothetical protein
MARFLARAGRTKAPEPARIDLFSCESAGGFLRFLGFPVQTIGLVGVAGGGLKKAEDNFGLARDLVGDEVRGPGQVDRFEDSALAWRSRARSARSKPARIRSTALLSAASPSLTFASAARRAARTSSAIFSTVASFMAFSFHGEFRKIIYKSSHK